MTVFYDDFERANGAPGNGWSIIADSPVISGGYLTCSGNSLLYQTGVSSASRHEATIHCGLNGGNALLCRVGVKYLGSGINGYWAYVGFTTPNYILYVGKGSYTLPTVLASTTIGTTFPFSWAVSLVYDAGHLTATYNGSVTAEADDIEYAGWEYMAIAMTHSAVRIADFQAVAGAAAALVVSPDVIGNYGTCTDLALTGTSTNWTPGTPGSPIFTVDHGTISAQTILTATTATITYCPGDYLGSIIFTDPSTGATDGAIVTSNPAIVPPSDLCPFDEDFITTANATLLAANRGLPTLQSVIVPAAEGWGAVYLQEALTDIWYSIFRPGSLPPGGPGQLSQFVQLLQLIAGSETPTVNLYTAERTTSIREELEGVTDHIDRLVTPTDYTLENVIASIKGLDNRSVTQVYDLVDAITPDNNQNVLDMLAAMWGADTPTLTQIATMISDIATIAGYTLADVLTAIAAIPGADLTPVLHKLDHIQPSEAADLTTITNQLTHIDVNVDAIVASLAALRTGSFYTLQDILDAIAAIPGGGGGNATPTAPVWPGLASVTLGPELALADDLTLTGPLHGLLFTITGQPEHNQKYMFGAVASWARVGQVLFTTDRGDYERSQTFGIDRQVLTPLTMEVASSAIVRVNPNWTGTVRLWTRT